MVVVDTSVLIPALTSQGPQGDAAREALNSVTTWIAPAHLAAECISALRGQVLGRKLSAGLAARAIENFNDLDIVLYPISPLIPRMWELRHNLTPYDAAYVALAESEGCPLLTADARIAAAPGLRCRIDVLK